MKVIFPVGNKYKFCGITLFKFKIHPSGIYFYLFGIRLWRCRNKLSTLIQQIKNNKNFDMKQFDEEIASSVSQNVPASVQPNQHKIAFLATTLYDMGGHTKCIKDLIKSLDGIYNQKLFLSHLSTTLSFAPHTVPLLERYAEITGIESDIFRRFDESVRKLTDMIIQYAPKVLCAYIHPDDVVGAAVLSLIKKAGIKIIFFNHASHFPSLGLTFADIILEGMPSTAKVTHEKRHLYNTRIVGLQSLAKDETVYYSSDKLLKLKQHIGISENNLVTMSGGNAYKFFDQNGESAYFIMILHILKKEKKLNHVVISEFNDRQKAIINDIFKNAPDEKKRLIFLPFQPNFDQYFQCADVFIDSFPVSSALTQIDLMRNKVASVVKINTEIPEYSFHEYQMPDYPYMFEKTEDMENAVCELLHNPKKRKELIEKNYIYWLKTYENNVVKNKYINVIEDVSNGNY